MEIYILVGFLSAALAALLIHLYEKNSYQKSIFALQQVNQSLEQALEHEKQLHAAQIKILEEAKDQLRLQFQQLSEEALQRNMQQLLILSKQQQEKQYISGNAALQQRQVAIQEMLNPVKDLLQRLEREAKNSGEKQAQTHGRLTEQVQQLAALQVKVQAETQSLVDALKRPETRGRWGEITLKRVLEESGMMENCAFSEQTSMHQDNGSMLRPDVVLSLPHGRKVAIDSKTPLDAYISLIDHQDNEGELLRHVRHMKTHLKQLSSKQYWDSLKDSPEFVIMFVPVESAFALAVKQEPSLLEEGWRNKVVIATPSTLMATIMAVSWTWKEQAIQDDMENLKELGKSLYERLNTFAGYLDKTGRALNTAMTSYNQAVSSFDTRLIPAARKFSDLSGKEIPALKQQDTVIKLPAA